MLVKEGRHKDLLLIREKEKLVMNILKKIVIWSWRSREMGNKWKGNT